MDEILKTLAAHTGISVETARTALGAILSFLKGHLPEGLAGQLMSALPGAAPVASSFESSKAAEHSGGLLASLTGLAGRLFGAGAAAEAPKLLATLQHAGMDTTQIQAFLPKALELIKAHVPAEIYEKIVGLIPGFAPAAEKV